MKLFPFLWNYIFERSFNLFDVAVFGYIWSQGWGLTNWQTYVTLVLGVFVSAIATQINERLKSFV